MEFSEKPVIMTGHKVTDKKLGTFNINGGINWKELQATYCLSDGDILKLQGQYLLLGECRIIITKDKNGNIIIGVFG